MPSCNGGSSSATVFAMRKSSSALRTHFLVSLVIKHFAFCRNLPQKNRTLLNPLFQFRRRSNNKVHGKWGFQRSADAHRLRDLIRTRHDHEQIDVAILRRLAIRKRTEQDDLFWLESFGDLTRIAANRRHG